MYMQICCWLIQAHDLIFLFVQADLYKAAESIATRTFVVSFFLFLAYFPNFIRMYVQHMNLSLAMWCCRNWFVPPIPMVRSSTYHYQKWACILIVTMAFTEAEIVLSVSWETQKMPRQTKQRQALILRSSWWVPTGKKIACKVRSVHEAVSGKN